MSKEIIEKIEKQDKYFDEIYQLLETVYQEMPNKSDVNKERLENSVQKIKQDVEDLKFKIEHLTTLVEELSNK